MRRLRRTTLIAVGCGAVILGIGYARLSYASIAVGWLLFSLPFLFAGIIAKSNYIPVACILFFGFVLGWYQGGKTLYRLQDYEQVYGHKVIVQVKADSDGAYNDKGQITFDGSKVEIIEPESRSLNGRITVSGYGTSDIRRGDTVEAEGKLYPTLGGKQARMSFAQMQVILRSGSFVETIRREFLASLRTVLPEPQASFGAGLLIGQTRELPQEYVDALRTVGLSHIIAVSGYNLTILAAVFGKRAGKHSKFRGLVLSLIFIGLFVMIAGTSASIARAAVVAVLSAFAGYYGRSFKPVLLILLVAAASGILNPLNVWGDVGWYLSFLAFFGVLVVAPIIQRRFWGEKEPKLIWQIVIGTFSAQLMTIPFTLFVFHQLSLVSLLANMIVLPLIPAAMLFTAIAGIAGMTPFPVLALLLAVPANWLLKAILDIAVLFSRAPYASVEFTVSVIGMFLSYVALLLLVLLLVKKREKTEVMVQ